MNIRIDIIGLGILISCCILINYFVGNFKDVFNYIWDIWHLLPTISGSKALLFGMSIAFVWVEEVKLGSVKPFNCMKCMTGWFTFMFAVLFHVPFAIFHLFIGVFAGALFSAIKMRWL